MRPLTSPAFPRLALAALAVAALAACSPGPSQSPPQLETGITANNGGGTRTLNNQPNIGVTTPVGRGY